MQKSSKMNRVSKDSGGDCLEKPTRKTVSSCFVFFFPHCTENEMKAKAGRRLTEASMERKVWDKTKAGGHAWVRTQTRNQLSPVTHRNVL